MKKIIISMLLFGFLIFMACTPTDPTQPEDESINAGTLVLSKMVAVGNSLTAGVQSTGLREDFQMHSYPYLIAQQMGQAANFEQPIVASPGLGSPLGMTPQNYDPATGAITQDPLTVDPLSLLSNAYLPRAYDNMGVPGFDLYDAMNTLTGGMADLVLRNPTFGNTSQIEQAMALNPTLLILWLGANDVLGAALDGGDPTQITSVSDFTSRLTAILNYIRVDQGYDKAIIMANIPNVSDIPYINMLDIVFRDLGNGAVPVLFDATFQPIDFGMGMMLPILTEETDVVHVTLPGALAYQAGLGVPDSTYFVDVMGWPPGMAAALVAGLVANGITPTGMPLPGTMTITATEETAIATAVAGFNQVIGQLATGYQVSGVMDANSALSALNSPGGIDGFTGHYVYMNPTGTAFSLDGVHPNNAGYAIIANEFIKVINSSLGQSIPEIVTSQYGGQYTGALPKIASQQAVEGVRELFRKK